MASSPAVLVLDQFRVSPPPRAVASDAALPLTFFDVAWLFTGPVERLFFYRNPHPTSHFLHHSLPLLRSSLSLALQRFYPLAGTIEPSAADEGGAPFLYLYSYGDAVSFVVAECSDGFDHIVERSPRDLGKLRPLVPRLPEGEGPWAALAAVQATVFPGCGVCIGVSIHHAACDDATAMHFVRTWATACRLGGLVDTPASPPPPVLDRALVADPGDLRGKALAGMKQLAASSPPPPATEAETPAPLMASFLITREQIDRIKAAASTATSSEPVHSSAFVASCAFAWVCLLKSHAVGGAERSHMLFSVECRSRLTPPVPAEYFGNCLRPCFVQAAAADLLSERGIVTAASAIGKAIQELELGVLEGAEGWLGRVVSVLPERPMSVGGSPRYRVYDTDFGWGRPARVEMVSVEKTPGTVALAESPEGDGGVEVGVVLPRDAMETFASCFADELNTAILVP